MKNVDDLKLAASKLRDCHFQWIVDAALDHFNAEIQKCEVEIVRHEHFAEEPFFDYRTLDETRAEKIVQSRQRLCEYRNIVSFLRVLSQISLNMSAQKFAWEVASTFRK